MSWFYLCPCCHYHGHCAPDIINSTTKILFLLLSVNRYQCTYIQCCSSESSIRNIFLVNGKLFFSLIKFIYFFTQQHRHRITRSKHHRWNLPYYTPEHSEAQDVEC